MERLSLLVCLSLICMAAADVPINPRGARPVEHGTRDEKCATQREWPFCTDDEWGPKCPSGCRIDGLMNKYDHTVHKKIEKIRSLLNQNSAKHRSADHSSKQTYDYLRDKLTVDSGHDNDYYNLAQNLRQRISNMKIKIDRQMRILAALKDRVKDQVVEMQRLEVDIDIKLRSCKGSCKGYSEYQVDQESYVALDKQIKQLDSQSAQNLEPVRTLYVMKSKPLKDVIVESIYKSKDATAAAAQQTEDMFPEVNTHLLIMEEEGSSSSPATITKVTGTSYSPPTSSSSSSGSASSSSSSTSITEFGGPDHGLFGGEFDGLGQPSTSHVITESVSCTRSLRTTVEHTKDGPVERTEEVIEGGPGCHALTDSTKGALSALFPTLTHTSNGHTSSSHTSTSYTSSSHTSGTKGSVSADTNTEFGNPLGSDLGFDIGAFMTANAEEDVPNLQFRSAKGGRVERQADYVGKVCERLKQQNQDGRQLSSHTNRKQRCRAKSDVALCSDDDWVSKCPSGCRLQGLISQMESEVERKLRKVCKTAKMYEDATEKSMTAMTHIYNYNRRVILNRYTSELKFVEHAEGLARNLTSLRKRSSRLSQQLNELQRNVQKQLEDLYRTEVDIDMKLRACSGSCRLVLPFSVDHFSYQTLHTETLSHKRKAATPPKDIPQIKLQPVDVGPAPSAEYKTIATVQREQMTQFEDIGQNRVVLEEFADAPDPADLD